MLDTSENSKSRTSVHWSIVCNLLGFIRNMHIEKDGNNPALEDRIRTVSEISCQGSVRWARAQQSFFHLEFLYWASTVDQALWYRLNMWYLVPAFMGSQWLAGACGGQKSLPQKVVSINWDLNKNWMWCLWSGQRAFGSGEGMLGREGQGRKASGR